MARARNHRRCPGADSGGADSALIRNAHDRARTAACGRSAGRDGSGCPKPPQRADRNELIRFGDLAARAQVPRSPRFFLNAPVVLDLKEAAEFTSEAEFAEAREILRRHTLTLIGIQNAAPAQADAAAAAGLAGFAPNATQPSRPRPAEAAPTSQSHASLSAAKSRLITQPVRSGTQIYARGADLVVTAPVSPGAEIMADGNIHVYAALRGRALAGA